MRALRIAPDTTVTELDLPESGAHSTSRDHIGTTGPVDHGVYHRRALLHIHGDGHRMGLAQNITAWALASTWRGLALYPIHGRSSSLDAPTTGEWLRWTTSWLSTRTRLRRPYAKH
jgi:hypothetical protein